MTAETDARPRHHPVVQRHEAELVHHVQLRFADALTSFAGSLSFVYLHAVGFAVWMTLLEAAPWPTLTLVVSLEAIFLSTFVLIGQNRQAQFQREKADHDFLEEEMELRTNTDLTRHIHALTTELYRRVIVEHPEAASPGSGDGSTPSR